MALNNVKQFNQADDNGFTRFGTWRKSPTQTTGAGIWFDLSTMPGNPIPNYYVGPANTFTPLKQSTDVGMPHCVDPADKIEQLRTLCIMSANGIAPLPVWLLDYVGFYPLLDESVLDPQPLTTSQALPRHTDGKGVQMMGVVSNGQAGGKSFVVTYTNSEGVTGRVTRPHIMNAQSVIGTVIHSGGAQLNSVGPFMTLQDGDSGVRLIESIQFLDSGDYGLMTLVLVKPIATHQIRDFQAPYEVDYFQNAGKAPIIAKDAYLNLICMPPGNLAGSAIHGYIKTILG